MILCLRAVNSTMTLRQTHTLHCHPGGDSAHEDAHGSNTCVWNSSVHGRCSASDSPHSFRRHAASVAHCELPPLTCVPSDQVEGTCRMPSCRQNQHSRQTGACVAGLGEASCCDTVTRSYHNRTSLRHPHRLTIILTQHILSLRISLPPFHCWRVQDWCGTCQQGHYSPLALRATLCK